MEEYLTSLWNLFEHTCMYAEIAFSLSQSDRLVSALIMEHWTFTRRSMLCGGAFSVLYFNMKEKFCQVFFSKIFFRYFSAITGIEILISVPYFFAMSKKIFFFIFLIVRIYFKRRIYGVFFILSDWRLWIEE